MSLSIQELWELNNKAQENFLYSGKEKRYLEAFLIQSCLLEGSLKELMILLIKKELKQSDDIIKRKEKKYRFDTVIDDLYIMRAINIKEFNDLHKYRKDRNRYIHHLIKKDYRNLNRSLKSVYQRGSSLVVNILKKLERV